jgi:REP-associated tyrosine transposase
MPRPPRLEIAGGLYHLISRGNGRKRIFLGDHDRLRFLRQMRDNLTTHDVVLYAYVLMDNHYHLLVKTHRANLSRFVQRLNTSYALYFHHKHRNPGHVFQGRYRANLVENDEYLVALSRYIHLNPVRTAAARRMSKSQRVRRFEAFRFSSYSGYVKAAAEEPWICYGPRKIFATSDVAARRHYRAYVRACVMEDDGPLLDAMRASRHAIGSRQFAEEIEREFKQRRTGQPTDRDVELPREQVDPRLISRVVAAAYGIDPAVLRQHGRRAGEAKAVALELACRHTGLNQRQIGQHYGKITSMAVCMARRRFREDQAGQHPALQKRLARLEKKILAGG